MSFRILITGSRNWSNTNAIVSAFAVVIPGSLRRPNVEVVVVHGDAPGADTLAGRIAEQWGFDVESHPAQWDRNCDQSCYHPTRMKDGKPYCPVAGHLRNQHMVDLGADVCLAFPTRDSRGTWDCVRRAEKAGIPVYVTKG